jgi:hypothetical protein
VDVRVAVVDGLVALIPSLIVVVEDAVVDIPLLIMVVVDKSSPSVTVYKCDDFIFDENDVTICILCIVDNNIGVLKASTALRLVEVIVFVSEVASRTM